MSFNVAEEERSILGRIACALNISTGELVRRFIARAMEIDNPTEADALKRARRMHVINASILLAVGLLMVIGETLSPSIDMGRARSRNRRNDVVVEVSA